VIETSLVILARFGEAGEPQLDRLLRSIGAEVVPVDEEQVALARDAALRFGRGRHHAALNFGDCFSYALAIARDEPLLFVGHDFTKTDVEVCQW
jgi:ribonuclease VapC